MSLDEKPYPAPPEYEVFKKRILDLTGIDLNAYKFQIHRRVHMLMQRWNVTSYDEYYKAISTREEKLREFLDYLTINVSEFFRNANRWWELRDKVFPSLFREVGQKKLKLWSAGCATGEEPYSLAILAIETGLTNPQPVLAADIDRGALAKAQAGVFQKRQLVNAPPEWIPRYFTEIDANTVQVKPQVKEKVSFRQMNLIKDPFDPGMGRDPLSQRGDLLLPGDEERPLPEVLRRSPSGGIPHDRVDGTDLRVQEDRLRIRRSVPLPQAVVALRQVHVGRGQKGQFFSIPFPGRTHHPTRDSHDHAPRRDHRPFGDDRSGGHDGPRSHHRSVQHHRPHGHEASPADAAAMEDRSVPYGHILLHLHLQFLRHVEHAPVLDVGPGTHHNPVQVPPEHRMVPDAGPLPELHASDESRCGSHKGVRCHVGGLPLEGVEGALVPLLVHRSHPP